MDPRILVEKSFDENIEDIQGEAWEFETEAQVDQKKTVGTARPCKLDVALIK